MTKNKAPSRTGFTLVEMLLTIVIIAILSGLVVGVSGYANRKAAESEAEADLQKLANILSEYRIETGSLPGNESTTFGNFTDSLFSGGGTRIQSMVQTHFWDQTSNSYDFSDPWGNDYQYRKVARFAAEFRSLGPDGRTGGTYDDDNLYSSQKTTSVN
jgi:general secretion pathway protein G